jgi:hypothetical protein
MKPAEKSDVSARPIHEIETGQQDSHTLYFFQDRQESESEEGFPQEMVIDLPAARHGFMMN